MSYKQEIRAIHVPSIHDATDYTVEFIKKLKPITDFSKVKEETKIFSKQSNNPLNLDLFLRTEVRDDISGIVYENTLSHEHYFSSTSGWYYWDEESAYETLLDSTDKHGKTLFMNGIISHKSNIIDYFITNNLDVTKVDHTKRQALYYAAQVNNFLLCEELVSRKSDLHAVDSYSNSLFHAASSLDYLAHALHRETALNNYYKTISFLIDQGLDVNAKNDDDETPLMLACRQSTASLNVIELLIESGANINEEDVFGFNALLGAIEHNHVNIAKLLLKHNAVITTKIVESIKSEEMANLFNEYIHSMDMDVEGALRARTLYILMNTEESEQELHF